MNLFVLQSIQYVSFQLNNNCRGIHNFKNFGDTFIILYKSEILSRFQNGIVCVRILITSVVTKIKLISDKNGPEFLDTQYENHVYYLISAGIGCKNASCHHGVGIITSLGKMYDS